EECLRIIEIAPQYLDVHQALAEIYVQQGKVDQAITKYAILIDTFLVNGRVDDAIAAYRRILQLEPNNITYRVRLINLLAQHGRTDEVMGERISAAESYLKMGYPERAIEQFEQALIASPNNLGVRQSYALALVRAGRVNQGIAELQRILQVEPNNTLTLARWQIALCLGAGNLSSAGGLAQSNVRMMQGDGSTRVAALEILGRLIRTLRMEGMRKYDEILREYQSAIETSPTNGDLRYAMGVIYHTAGRYQEAIAHYQAAMGAPGLDVMSHVGVGLALLGLNDAAAASSAVRELEAASASARQSPLQPAIWAARPRLDGEDALAPDVEIAQILSRAYHRSNPNAAPMPYGASPGMAVSKANNVPVSRPTAFSEEITRTINEIAARHPNDAAGMLQEMVQLVRTYRGQRQYEQAVMVLNEITRVAPEDASVRAELADIHITRGLLDEGIEELRRVAEIYMQHNQVNEAAATLQQIGEIQWQMGQQEPAMATLKQVLNLTPDDMNARMLYVQYCLELGLRKEASEQQTVLARYYYHSRQTREAVAMLQQLIALDKDNFEAYDLLGQTYFSVGEYDSAQRVYRHLTKSNPNSSLARERLAQIQEMRARR
ncbi:MAG TPA: tetratricopeptide repeat protein, partial [Ktedonobacterales bacterium]|nr:tetratricopeptide repeat protein [Ktedonobacterales bacterium]